MQIREKTYRLVTNFALVVVVFFVLVACDTEHGPEPSLRLSLHVYRGESNEENLQVGFDRSFQRLVLRGGTSVFREGVVDETTFGEVAMLVRSEDLPAYRADPSFVSGERFEDAFPGSETQPLYHLVVNDDRFSGTPSFDAWTLDAPEAHEPTKALLRRADAILEKVPP